MGYSKVLNEILQVLHFLYINTGGTILAIYNICMFRILGNMLNLSYSALAHCNYIITKLSFEVVKNGEVFKIIRCINKYTTYLGGPEILVQILSFYFLSYLMTGFKVGYGEECLAR